MSTGFSTGPRLTKEENSKAAAALVALLEIEKSVRAGGTNGWFQCTHCKTGRIMWAVAGRKKHVRASCTTNGCLEFME